jgi:hypothetical protein
VNRDDLDRLGAEALCRAWSDVGPTAQAKARLYIRAVLDACLPAIEAEWEQVGWLASNEALLPYRIGDKPLPADRPVFVRRVSETG